MRTRLILIRHGVTNANLSGLFLGRTDVDLSLTGRRQAKALTIRLQEEYSIDALYSSPLKRAHQTAEVISQHTNLPINLSDNLMELDFGKWEGQRHEEIAISYPNEYISWETDLYNHKIPGAESMYQLEKRLWKDIVSIVHKNRHKTIAIVSHGICLKVLMMIFKGIHRNSIPDIPWYENTAVNIIEIDDEGNFFIIKENDTQHLDDTDGLNITTFNLVDQYIEDAKNSAEVLG